MPIDKIRKIRLGDSSGGGTTTDVNAIRLNNGTISTAPDELLITGIDDTAVDKMLLEGNLRIERGGLNIASVDSIPAEDSITNVLVQSSGGQIKKRSVENLLEDIGGKNMEVKVDEATHTLSFKIGK